MNISYNYDKETQECTTVCPNKVLSETGQIKRVGSVLCNHCEYLVSDDDTSVECSYDK